MVSSQKNFFLGYNPAGAGRKMKIYIILCAIMAAQSTPRRSSVEEVSILLNFTSSVECKRSSFGHCERGTVKLDPYLDFSLATQRWIQMDLPWDQITMIGTHNSFNDRGDNYGIFDSQLQEFLTKFGIASGEVNIAQQAFTMTDTLNFGIRSIQLDAQWCFGKLRLAHAGNDLRRLTF